MNRNNRAPASEVKGQRTLPGPPGAKRSTGSVKPLLRFLWLNLLLAFPLHAQSRIAVLEFELKDLTLNPNTSEELERTASIKPMLEKILEARGGFTIIKINPSARKDADVATGYFFDHFDVTAEFGNNHGADYILVGRVHKASFLFVYFMAHMIDTRTQQLVGNYICEVKGPQRKLTIKGVECLVEKIQKTLDPGRRRVPAPG